jgi:hypothetical protein
MRLLFAHAFLGAGSGAGGGQQAVAALLQGAGIPFVAQPLLSATENWDPGRDRRPGRSTQPRGGSPPCRPRPGTPGSPPIWPRCGPAGSP